MQGGELRVETISKRFGGLRVFTDVTFTLAPAEIMGVIGPNGAGKTTLINVICGTLTPSSGRILLDGKPITGKPVHELSRRGLVRSFQQTNTFKSATVRENLSRAIRFSGSPASICMPSGENERARGAGSGASADSAAAAPATSAELAAAALAAARSSRCSRPRRSKTSW